MSTLVFVLSAVLGQADDPSAQLWQQNYTQAQRMAAQDKKPVAVFLTRGQNGLSTLISGGLNEQAKSVLTSNYIPVMVDTSTPEGQRLARAFEIREGQGLVLSDRGGARQAFWFQGNLTNEDLIRNLEKYANQTDIRMTEVAGRTSLYGPGEEQSTSARRTMRRGSEVAATSGERERRLRLFQGRMTRRSTY
jgi:hypothetical protein